MNIQNHSPKLLLGTAMWAWTIPKPTAFSILDAFYSEGFRAVDCATNYPINQISDDFRGAETILAEWIRAHGVQDLEVMMKVGSLNNMRTPDHNLNPSFLMMAAEQYRHLLDKNLHTFMIHWDNRDQQSEVNETINTLQNIHNQGVNIGLSGIKHPELYQQVGLDVVIQMKHNLIQSDYDRYAAFHGKRCFIAYGINAGGLKLNREEYAENSSLKMRGGNTETEHPRITKLKSDIQRLGLNIQDFSEIALTYAYSHPDMYGILVGPSNATQLKNTIHQYRALSEGKSMILEIFN
jgi:aryl-alcohol dehydrogenase-like predicted oxidoreductase